MALGVLRADGTIHPLTDAKGWLHTSVKRLRASFVRVLRGHAMTAAVEPCRDLIRGGALDERSLAEACCKVLAIRPLLQPVGWAVGAVLPKEPLAPVPDWPRLVLVAKYNIFRTGTLACGRRDVAVVAERF